MLLGGLWIGKSIGFIMTGQVDPYIVLWVVVGTGGFLCLLSLLRNMNTKGVVYNG